TSQLQQAEARLIMVAERKNKPVEAVSQKQKIKASLEAYLVQLEDRVLAIKKMTLFEYDKSLKKEEDIESIDLLNEIYFFLDLNLGKTESAWFKSRTGISFASINDWGQSAFKAEKWQGMIDNLNHFASQLKKIIENQTRHCGLRPGSIALYICPSGWTDEKCPWCRCVHSWPIRRSCGCRGPGWPQGKASLPGFEYR